MTIFKGVGASGGTPKSLSVSNATTNQYMTFESPVGTDYVVPAGKTFKITRVIMGASAVAGGGQIGYGDNGVPAGATAPTNLVQVTPPCFVTETARKVVVIDVYIEIPAGKYPCWTTNATASNGCDVLIIGVEE